MIDPEARKRAALDLLDDLLARAGAAAADAADALAVESTSLAASYRLGELEDVERAEARDLGLRVFVGKRQAFVSSTDTSADALDRLVERALAMARIAPENRWCGLADEAVPAPEMPDLDLFDAAAPSAEDLVARAAEAEDAARAVAGVTNSEGAEASWDQGVVALATSAGFRGAYAATSHSLSAAVVAGGDGAMERDYDYQTARHGADLESPAAIGRRAGERAVKRLHPRRAKTKAVPVLFDPRVSAGLVRHLANALSGTAIARRSSFLKDAMGERILPAGVAVIDEPRRPRGLASKPFDAEGVATRRLALVEDGVLASWILESSSARQLGLATTGHAARGTGGPPGPATTNLYLTPGAQSPDKLLAAIYEGLYVTELSGFGVNPVTGDYSRGAAGFWIERGALAYPVSEITIAGNLKDMFMALTPADDLEFRYSANAPTLRVDGMTVGGGG